MSMCVWVRVCVCACVCLYVCVSVYVFEVWYHVHFAFIILHVSVVPSPPSVSPSSFLMLGEWIVYEVCHFGLEVLHMTVM